MSAVTLADLQGIWRRTVLTAPGIEDRETAVYWAQGPTLHVDLRIAPGCQIQSGVQGLSALGRGEQEIMRSFEGFAGTTSVAGSVCTWARRINWRGPPEGADIGALSWGPDGTTLIEDGVHATYSETWERIAPGPMHQRLYGDPDGQHAILVWSDAAFMIGRGDPAATEQPPAQGPAAFDQAFTMGHWQGAHGVADISTHPWLIGKAVIGRPDDTLRLRRTTAHGLVWQHWDAIDAHAV